VGALPVGTVTFFFSDIERSTDLSRQHGVGFGDLRAEQRRVLRDAFAAHSGSVIDAEGDAFFVVFERATDAVAAAVDAQRALSPGPVRVRIGIHTTEPHLHGDGYVGVGVSRAARICAAAHGGQVVVSNVTAGVIEDQALPGVGLRDLGEYRLKDIPRPERLFQVEAEGLASEFPRLDAASTTGSVATLLATDLAGWGRALRQLGDDAAADLTALYHGIVDRHVRANDGRQIERIADHTLSVFSAPEQALVAASAIRAALGEGWAQGTTEKLPVCTAIHTGRLARPSEGFLGSPAVRVVRLCMLAEPGQILVSNATQALLEGQRLNELTIRDLGEQTLPGSDDTPSHVYELVNEPAAPSSEM
jgi:class 3 adenylate cyclase